MSSQESWHKLEIRKRHFMSTETPRGPFEGSVLRRVRIRRFEKYSILLDGLMGVLYLTQSLSLSDFHKLNAYCQQSEILFAKMMLLDAFRFVIVMCFEQQNHICQKISTFGSHKRRFCRLSAKKNACDENLKGHFCPPPKAANFCLSDTRFDY